LVLFRLGAAIGERPTSDPPVVFALAVGLLLIVGSGFAQVYVARAARDELPASSLLRLSREETKASNESLSRLLEAQLKGFVNFNTAKYVALQSTLVSALKTEEATARLAERNAKAKWRLGVAQFLFAFALPYLVLAFSLWAYTADDRSREEEGHAPPGKEVLRTDPSA